MFIVKEIIDIGTFLIMILILVWTIGVIDITDKLGINEAFQKIKKAYNEHNMWNKFKELF